MDDIGMICILAGTFTFGLGMALSVVFTTIQSRHFNELKLISAPSRKRVPISRSR